MTEDCGSMPSWGGKNVFFSKASRLFQTSTTRVPGTHFLWLSFAERKALYWVEVMPVFPTSGQLMGGYFVGKVALGRVPR
jgi:hypothetical protein